jgi:pilus assembly protein CpaC
MRFIQALLLIGILVISANPAWAGYKIEINKSQVIRVDRPVVTVVAANREIADVQVLSPSVIYINGRSLDETTVLIMNKLGNEIINTDVSVTHNLKRLNETLKSQLPNADVEFDSVAGAIVIKGQVKSPVES